MNTFCKTPRRRQATTNYPRRVGVLTKPCKRLRDADRRLQTIPRRVGVLTMPLQKAPPAEGEMKLRHGFCQKSLRLISFATSLCTREAFAVRRLQTFPRRAGVLAKPCKRPAPPPGDHQLDLKSLCLLLFLSHQVCMDREKTVRLFSLCFGAGRRNSPGSERSICQTMGKAAKARPFPANAFAGQARSGRYNGE